MSRPMMTKISNAMPSPQVSQTPFLCLSLSPFHFCDGNKQHPLTHRPMTPAQFAAPVSFPNLLTIDAIHESTSARLETLTFVMRHLPPRFGDADDDGCWNDACARAIAASSMSPIATLAPRESKISTTESPMPLAPPVTAMTCPSNSCSRPIFIVCVGADPETDEMLRGMIKNMMGKRKKKKLLFSFLGPLPTILRLL